MNNISARLSKHERQTKHSGMDALLKSSAILNKYVLVNSVEWWIMSFIEMSQVSLILSYFETFIRTTTQ